MTHAADDAPLACPQCRGKKVDWQEVEVAGRVEYLPCLCEKCAGQGFLTLGFYRRLKALSSVCKRDRQLQSYLVRMGFR